MLQRLWEYIENMKGEETAMWLLLLFILILTVVALVFVWAAVVLRMKNDRRRVTRTRLEKTWQPLILDYLVGRKTDKEVHQHVARSDRYFFTEVLYRFSTHVTGSEKERLIALANPYLAELSRRVKTGSVESRARAVQLLSVLGFEQYKYQLMEALDDRSPLVAITAARALARPEHPAVAQAQLQAIERFRYSSTEHLAAMLHSLGPSIAPQLRWMLQDTFYSTRARVIVAEALYRLEDIPSADVCAELLEKQKPEPELLASLVRLMSKGALPRHLPKVRELLASPHEAVRVEAAATLSVIGEPDDVELLLPLLNDESQWVSLQAARSIRTLGGGEELKMVAAVNEPMSVVAREVLQEQPA